MDSAKANLPSYRDISPSETGGRVARRGFDYQDHIGAGFCLDLFTEDGLVEVWFEQHDDLVLVWEDGTEVVEMVQVKHEDLPSRYSSAFLTRRDKGVGTSMLERSLARSNGREDTRFRLITSYGVMKELEPLTHPLGTPARLGVSAALGKLRVDLANRLSDASVSADGTSVSDWVDKCWWDKREEDKEAVMNRNLLRLEQVLASLGLPVFGDQRDDIYLILVSLVRDKSGPEGADDYTVSRGDLEALFRETSARQKGGAAGGVNLRRKMDGAGLSPFTEDAMDLYLSFRTSQLEGQYSRPIGEIDVESEVTAVLSRLKVSLYSGEVQGGLPFHKRCLEALDQVRDRVGRSQISDAALQGMMYSRTNRCSHLFDTEAR